MQAASHFVGRPHAQLLERAVEGALSTDVDADGASVCFRRPPAKDVPEVRLFVVEVDGVCMTQDALEGSLQKTGFRAK